MSRSVTGMIVFLFSFQLICVLWKRLTYLLYLLSRFAAILFPAGGNLFAFLRAELKSAVLTDCAFYRFVRRCKDQLSFSLLCRINCPHALYELPEQFESCLVD
jgi:hypothetical protein